MLPESFKHQGRQALAHLRMGRACRTLHRLRPPATPRERTLAGLLRGWGNEGFAATVEYLHELAESVLEGTGAILECGSGASTLLLGLLAPKVGRRVYTLEHDPRWRDEVLKALERYDVTGVEVILAPLRDYGDRSWYDLTEANLPSDITLVVCDGPPNTTAGGRSGLMHVGRPHLRRGCKILFDDAAREAEHQMLTAWQAADLIRFDLVQNIKRPYAIARLQ